MDEMVSKVMDKKKKRGLMLLLYIVPGLLLIFLFCYLPLWGWAFAFFQYKPGRALLDCNFVGWSNFKELFGNMIMRKNLLRVLQNTFGIHFLGYLFSPLPMFFAILLSEVRSKKFQRLIQTITTLPNFISWVIMFSLAVSLFGSNGLMNTFFKEIGISFRINFLNSDKHVWLTQVLLQQWKNLGWGAIIYFAAIAGLDQELFEAAMVDGANPVSRFFKITLPLLTPTIFFNLVMQMINGFLAFTQCYIITQGKPMNSTLLYTVYMYQQSFEFYNTGYGAAMAWVMLLMIGLITLFLFATKRFWVYEGGL